MISTWALAPINPEVFHFIGMETKLVLLMSDDDYDQYTVFLFVFLVFLKVIRFISEFSVTLA